MSNNNQPLIYMLSSIYNLLPVKLDDGNYIAWLFQMKNVLKSLDLEGYIDGTINVENTRDFQEWEKNDKALMTLISATLSSEALLCVVGSKNSCEAWKNLRVRYGVHSRTAAMQLQTKLYTTQKGNDTVDQYFQRIKIFTDQLASIGILIPDEELVISAANGLPSEYMTIKVVVKSLCTTMYLNKLRSLLLDEESTADQSSKSVQDRMHNFNHIITPITSSAAINVPNSSSNGQCMIPLSTNFDVYQAMSNSRHMLDNNAGTTHCLFESTLSYENAPQRSCAVSQNDHEHSQSTIQESSLQPMTNDAARNGATEIQNGRGRRPNVLSRDEHPPSIDSEAISMKRMHNSLKVDENIFIHVATRIVKPHPQPKFDHRRE